LQELSQRLPERHEVVAPISTIDDWFRSRRRADVQAARAVWRKRQVWLQAHPEQISRIVFIDETGINTKMARLRGRYPRGRRMVAAIPHGHWKTMTFIAGLRCDGLTAPWVIEGAMDGDAFGWYIATQFAPTLQKGVVVVFDNLPAHKRDDARRVVERRGAWLYCSCRPTRPTSIRSNSHSQSSKPT